MDNKGKIVYVDDYILNLRKVYLVNNEDMKLISVRILNNEDYPECLAGFHPAEDDERYSEG